MGYRGKYKPKILSKPEDELRACGFEDEFLRFVRMLDLFCCQRTYVFSTQKLKAAGIAVGHAIKKLNDLAPEAKLPKETINGKICFTCPTEVGKIIYKHQPRMIQVLPGVVLGTLRYLDKTTLWIEEVASKEAIYTKMGGRPISEPALYFIVPAIVCYWKSKYPTQSPPWAAISRWLGTMNLVCEEGLDAWWRTRIQSLTLKKFNKLRREVKRNVLLGIRAWTCWKRYPTKWIPSQEYFTNLTQTLARSPEFNLEEKKRWRNVMKSKTAPKFLFQYRFTLH